MILDRQRNYSHCHDGLYLGQIVGARTEEVIEVELGELKNWARSGKIGRTDGTCSGFGMYPGFKSAGK